MATRPFPVNPILVAIAIAYSNRALIADAVLPRLTPMSKEEFSYFKYTLADGFTIPDTKVGRRSKPNEVSFSGAEVTDRTQDYGLEDPIPQSDIDNADPRYSPLNHSTEQLTNLILLDREVRVANLVFNPATYAAANQETLAAGDQFSNPDADVLRIIEEGLNTPIMRPNVAVFGQSAWSALRRHPQINKAVHGNSGDAGMATRQQVAELFELQEILVGQSLLNTARKGQPVAMQQVWGNSAAFIMRDSMADNRNGTTFGFTAQYKTRVAGAVSDRDIGLHGGQRVRVGESVKEVISAPDLGYLMRNVA